MFLNAVELKEIVFMGAFFLISAVLLYYVMGFCIALLRFFTNTLGIYQLIYWLALFSSISCLWVMASPDYERGEAELLVFVGVATSLSARSIYFNCKKLNKKKN